MNIPGLNIKLCLARMVDGFKSGALRETGLVDGGLFSGAKKQQLGQIAKCAGEQSA